MMKLSIFSLKKILFEGEAESVNCRTENGEITILNHHIPLISSLKQGIIKIIDNERKTHYFPISGGFLEMNENRLNIIAEEGEKNEGNNI